MANVPNGVETGENFNLLGRMRERYRRPSTDRRQTDLRQHSERESEFTFAINCKVEKFTLNSNGRSPNKHIMANADYEVPKHRFRMLQQLKQSVDSTRPWIRGCHIGEGGRLRKEPTHQHIEEILN